MMRRPAATLAILPVIAALPRAQRSKALHVLRTSPLVVRADLETTTAEYINWFNHRRLHGEIGMIPPVELEDAYHQYHPLPAPNDAALASL